MIRCLFLIFFFILPASGFSRVHDFMDHFPSSDQVMPELGTTDLLQMIARLSERGVFSEEIQSIFQSMQQSDALEAPLGQRSLGQVEDDVILLQRRLTPPGFEEAVYNMETQELSIKRYLGDAQFNHLVFESSYHVAEIDPSERTNALLSLLSGYGFYLPRDHDLFVHNIINCPENRSHLPGADLENATFMRDLSHVLDYLYEDYLQNAIGEPEFIDDHQFTLDIFPFDQNVRLLIRLSEDGALDDVTILEHRHRGALELQVEMIELPSGEKTFVIKSPGFDLPLYRLDMNMSAAPPSFDVYVYGRKMPGDFNRHGYEKNVFLFNPDAPLERRLSSRQRLDGAREVGLEFSPASRGRRKRGLSFLARVFFSPSGRQEKVQEQIERAAREELIDSGDYAELFSNDDISQIAALIAQRVYDRTNRIRGNLGDIEVVATAQAYKVFAQEIIIRSVRQMIPHIADRDLNDILETGTRQFNACLESAEEQKNINYVNQCLQHFEDQGPVKIGLALTHYLLRDNDLSEYLHFSSEHYNSCISENLDSGRYSNLEAIDIVQACVYDTFLTVIPHAMRPQIESAIAQMGSDIHLNATEYQQLESLYQQCMSQERLISLYQHDSPGIEFLAEVDSVIFQHHLMSCIDQVTYHAGEFIITKLIGEELSFSAPELTSDELQDIIHFTIDHGYASCRTLQDEVSLAYPDHQYDPSLCEGVIRSLATQRSFKFIVRHQMSQELWNDYRDDFEQNVNSCFSQVNQQGLHSLSHLLEESYSYDQREEQSLDLISSYNADLDQQLANCLRQAIIWVSLPITRHQVSESLEALSQEFGDIDISEEESILMGLEIQQCISENLEGNLNTDQILERQEELTDLCALNMLRSDAAQDALFLPLLMSSLGDVGLSDRERYDFSNLLIYHLDLMTREAQSLEDFMQMASSFRPEATLLIIDAVLRERIDDSLGAIANTPAGDEFKNSLMDLIEQNLLSTDGHNFRQIFIDAASSDDAEQLNNAIEDFSIAAMSLIVEQTLYREANALMAEGRLSIEDIEDFVSFGNEILEQCLRENRDNNEVEFMEFCQIELKEQAVLWVIHRALNDELSATAIQDALENHNMEQLISEIIDSDILNLIALHARQSDHVEAESIMEQIVTAVTVSATQVVAPIVLTETLRGALGLREDDEHPIIIRVTDDLNNCFQSSNPTVEEQEKLNYCVNRARLEATSSLYNYSLLQLFRQIDIDDQLVSMLSEQSSSLQQCHQQYDFYMPQDEFEIISARCLQEILFVTIDQLVDWLDGEMVNREIFNQEGVLGLSWRECRQQRESDEMSIDEIQQVIFSCLSDHVLPDLLVALNSNLAALFEISISGLNQQQRQAHQDNLVLLSSLLTRTASLLRTRPEVVDLLISSFAQERSQRTTASEDHRDESRQNLWDTIDQSIELLSPLLLNIRRFDDGDLDHSFMRLLDQLEHDLALGVDINDTIAQSKFIDYLLLSFISDTIRQQADEALEAFIPSARERRRVVEKLSSVEMLTQIFNLDDPDVRELLTSLKVQAVIPFLSGEGSLEELLTDDLLRPVQSRLARDVRLGGFAETILAPVAQEGLDQASQTFQARAGRFFRVVHRNDFDWSHLRDKRGAGRVIDNFSEQLLLPLLTNQNLSEREISRRIDNLTVLIEQLVRE